MNNNAVGYNQELVKDALKQIYISNHNSQLNYCARVAGGIERLSEAWFAPEAKGRVQEVIDKFVDLMNFFELKHRELFEMVEKAAKNWASTVGGNYESTGLTIQREYPDVLDANIMRDKRNDGFVGFDLATYNSNATNHYFGDFQGAYGTDLENPLAEFENLETYFKTNVPFLGADQSIIFSQIIKVMSDKFLENLREFNAFENSIVKSTEEKYQQTAQSNASLFSSSN